MTGFPDPVLEAQARQFGAIFLLKPFTSGVLLALVEERLRDRPTNQALLAQKKSAAAKRPVSRRFEIRGRRVSIAQQHQ
jgi:hypothetical protein